MKQLSSMERRRLSDEIDSLLFGGQAGTLIKDDLLLVGGAGSLPGLGDGRDERDLAAVLDDLLRRLDEEFGRWLVNEALPQPLPRTSRNPW